jgi:hypothetical protein
MKKLRIKFMLCVFGIHIFVHALTYAQSNLNTIRVTDEKELPVAGASLIIGEGADPVFSSENGEVTILVKKRTPVLIEADGYESRIVYVSPGFAYRNEVLVKMPYMNTEKI